MDNQSYPLDGIKFRVYPGKNDLRSTAPDLAAEFHPTKNYPFTPDTVTRSSANVVWWLGACGHEWYASLNRRAQGQGCLVCSNKNKQIMVGIRNSWLSGIGKRILSILPGFQVATPSGFGGKLTVAMSGT